MTLDHTPRFLCSEEDRTQTRVFVSDINGNKEEIVYNKFNSYMILDNKTFFSNLDHLTDLFRDDLIQDISKEIEKDKGLHRATAYNYLPKEKNMIIKNKINRLYYLDKLAIKYFIFTYLHSEFGSFKHYIYEYRNRKLIWVDMIKSSKSICVTARDKYIITKNNKGFDIYNVETKESKYADINLPYIINSPDGNVIFYDSISILYYDVERNTMIRKIPLLMNTTDLSITNNYIIYSDNNKICIRYIHKNITKRIDYNMKYEVFIIDERTERRGDIERIEYLGGTYIQVKIKAKDRLDFINMIDLILDFDDMTHFKLSRQEFTQKITYISETKVAIDSTIIDMIEQTEVKSDLTIDSIFPFLLDEQVKEMEDKVNIITMLPINIRKIIGRFI